MLIGYARVSLAGDKQNLDMQLDALIAAGVDKRNIYTDRKSGVASDRPGLAKALSYLSPGDSLVVYRLDRLARSLKHLVQLVDDFKARDIHLVSVTQTIDTSTPTGVLLLQVFGVLGEFERELTRERIMDGIAAGAKRGRRGGRPKAISEEKLPYILADINAGMKRNEVCKKYGVHRATLYATLNREETAALVDSVNTPSENLDLEEFL